MDLKYSKSQLTKAFHSRFLDIEKVKGTQKTICPKSVVFSLKENKKLVLQFQENFCLPFIIGDTKETQFPFHYLYLNHLQDTIDSIHKIHAYLNTKKLID